MKSKVSRKNMHNSKRGKVGSGPEIPDIENQLHNISTIDNKYIDNKYIDNKEIKGIDNEEEEEEEEDIDKPKNVVEYVPQQKETSIEPIDEDIESNIPSDENFDLGDYGEYDRQFYGGITKKRRAKKNKSKKVKKTKKNKSKKSRRTKRNKKY